MHINLEKRNNLWTSKFNRSREVFFALKLLDI